MRLHAEAEQIETEKIWGYGSPAGFESSDHLVFAKIATKSEEVSITAQEQVMRKWQCMVCGFIYDEAQGLPEEGIAPGTKWEDIPDDWQCPDCGVSKDDFEMVQV